MKADLDMPIQMLRRKGGVRASIARPTSMRLPPDLLEHLRQCAAARGCSMGKEIVYRLTVSAEGESIDEHGVIVRVLRRPSK